MYCHFGQYDPPVGHKIPEALALPVYDGILGDSEDIHAHWNTIKAKLNAKVQEIRVARQLSTQLPQTGAALHELLGKELYYRVSLMVICN
ncbi:unnamed protein product [Cylicostephanus goldi]|uniref:Uncharacterized protein n=1 Tax=Cylicostephanus goldi TaxID=71465 RepID=A0A3P7MI02_CYLGO|nr:unnamed protein product [Cylicostephanus goldi]